MEVCGLWVKRAIAFIGKKHVDGIWVLNTCEGKGKMKVRWKKWREWLRMDADLRLVLRLLLLLSAFFYPVSLVKACLGEFIHVPYPP